MYNALCAGVPGGAHTWSCARSPGMSAPCGCWRSRLVTCWCVAALTGASNANGKETTWHRWGRTICEAFLGRKLSGTGEEEQYVEHFWEGNYLAQVRKNSMWSISGKETTWHRWGRTICGAFLGRKLPGTGEEEQYVEHFWLSFICTLHKTGMAIPSLKGLALCICTATI